MRLGKKRKTPRGLLIYSNIQDVLYAHSSMQREGMEATLVPPPLEVSAGCDLAVQFNPEEEEILNAMLARGVILPGKIHYIDYLAPEIENLARIKEIAPGYLMAVSNNIKVTMDQESHEIVNVSGGGCPDVPYVAGKIIGIRVEDCPDPVDIGSTLCTYMIQMAVDRLRREIKRC